MLVDSANGLPVPAVLHAGLRGSDLLLVERVWSAHRASIMARLHGAGVSRSKWPQSLHWDWSHKARELRLLVTSAFGISCTDQWQALMITETAPKVSRSEPDRGRPLVYVSFLEIAPWNWHVAEVQQVPRYRGCGSVLLRAAVQQSLGEEFGGRVGLHALPQSEAFYRRSGMTSFGADPVYEGLDYFEFEREAAWRFLQGVRE